MDSKQSGRRRFLKSAVLAGLVVCKRQGSPERYSYVLRKLAF